MCRTELTASGKLTYARLLQFAGHGGTAFCLQETLAAEVGLSRRGVRRCIAELVERKLIASEKRGRHESSTYRLLSHEWETSVSHHNVRLPNQDGHENDHLADLDGHQNDPATVIGMPGVKEHVKRATIATVEARRNVEREEAVDSSSPVTIFRSWWDNQYFAVYGVRYCWTHGKDEKIIQEMFGELDGNMGRLQAIGEAFLHDDDKWLGDKRTIGILRLRLNIYNLRLNANNGKGLMKPLRSTFSVYKEDKVNAANS